MTQVQWKDPVSGLFDAASRWSTNKPPSALDDAILDAAGPSYTVTVTIDKTVRSIQTASNATLDIFDKVTFTVTDGSAAGANAGAIIVDPTGKFVVGGTFTNTGSITLTGSRNRLKANIIAKGALTLDGGGTISLEETSYLGGLHATSNNSTLINVDNRIVGSGTIGDSHFPFDSTHILALANETSGVIDAGGSENLILIADLRSSTNAGMIEAIAGAISIDNVAIDNKGGTIEASSGGSVFVGISTISNGSWIIGSGSEITLNNTSALTNAHITIESDGTFNIVGASSVSTGGMLINAGTINTAGPLSLLADTTLSGRGTVSVSGGTISGATNASVLENVDNTIDGYGRLGAGALSLMNDADGVIDADNNVDALILDTGANAIDNAGLINATGIAVIASDVRNTGLIEVAGGTLTAEQGVSGPAGSVQINGGTLTFDSFFNERVTFGAAGGDLVLGQPQFDTSAITGFSTTGSTTLVVRSIRFVAAGEATFSGTAAGGTLTVTDGTNTARIKLDGDYLGAAFTASNDGAGGTAVAAEMADRSAAAHRFIAVTAGLPGATAGSMSFTQVAERVGHPVLARPGTAVE